MDKSVKGLAFRTKKLKGLASPEMASNDVVRESYKRRREG
jgi:hypothetical protein